MKKGDKVNIGDPILKKDTTMDNLNLQDLDIQIQKKVLEIFCEVVTLICRR